METRIWSPAPRRRHLKGEQKEAHQNTSQQPDSNNWVLDLNGVQAILTSAQDISCMGCSRWCLLFVTAAGNPQDLAFVFPGNVYPSNPEGHQVETGINIGAEAECHQHSVIVASMPKSTCEWFQIRDSDVQSQNRAELYKYLLQRSQEMLPFSRRGTQRPKGTCRRPIVVALLVFLAVGILWKCHSAWCQVYVPWDARIWILLLPGTQESIQGTTQGSVETCTWQLSILWTIYLADLWASFGWKTVNIFSWTVH